MTGNPETAAPICACHRCGAETVSTMTCDRCRRAIFRQAVRLGTLTDEEARKYG
jgi:primosomal protein N'